MLLCRWVAWNRWILSYHWYYQYITCIRIAHWPALDGTVLSSTVHATRYRVYWPGHGHEHNLWSLSSPSVPSVLHSRNKSIRTPGLSMLFIVVLDYRRCSNFLMILRYPFSILRVSGYQLIHEMKMKPCDDYWLWFSERDSCPKTCNFVFGTFPVYNGFNTSKFHKHT